jgi:RNA polymerase-binding transcription factor DksA
MATKKSTPKKKVAAKKVAAAKPLKKKISKPAPKKAVKKTVVKAVPKKATKSVVVKKAKPAKKATPKKAAPKKVAIKKVAPKKVAPKPVKKDVKQNVKAVSKSANKKVAVKAPKQKSIKAPAVAVSAKPSKNKKVAVVPAKPVKVPKITTKTSVPYKPGYTPLEKRVNPAAPNEPIVRYSDSELYEFRELISRKLEASKKELAYLQGLITRKDELGGDESENRYMTMEDGGQSMEREQLSQMAARQIAYIDHLEKALIRIENKTYGICRVTGKLIDKARLRAVPHATLSLEAKLGLVKPLGE